MNRNTMTYEDHLTKALGSRDDAKRKIRTSKDPVLGLWDAVKKGRKEANKGKPKKRPYMWTVV